MSEPLKIDRAECLALLSQLESLFQDPDLSDDQLRAEYRRLAPCIDVLLIEELL